MTLPNLTVNYNPEELPEYDTLPLQTYSPGFSASNVIVAGTNNKITDSRRCSIIQGASNEINNKYNTHIIGDFIEADLDNAFYVGCMNGLHVYGDVVAFAYSDERLKDNIKDLDKPLSKVLALDSVSFNWNDKQQVHKGKDIGLIAQQVEKVAPELVTERPDGYKAIKYDRINTLLVGAIKEQQKTIESLEARIAKLESKQ